MVVVLVVLLVVLVVLLLVVVVVVVVVGVVVVVVVVVKVSAACLYEGACLGLGFILVQESYSRETPENTHAVVILMTTMIHNVGITCLFFFTPFPLGFSLSCIHV